MANSADIVIIGAGPAGCATALAFQRRGADTLVLESSAQPSRRLAGEWIHPRGVQFLQRLGVDLSSVEHATAKGFVVFPEDDSEPVILPYSDSSLAVSGDHEALVGGLRAAVSDQPGITFATESRVTAIESDRVTYIDGRSGVPASVLAGWVIGADGRSSLVRESLGLPRGTRLSRMAGVLLENTELPFEGYGHILLGGPGPILIYRIGRCAARACIDVPLASPSRANTTAYLWEAYGPFFPPSLRPSFQAALRQRQIKWAANQFCPRTAYGDGRLALIGDAVGHFHPLTATGLTLAMMDGECLARSPGIAAYSRERAADTRVAEILAIAIHRAFTAHDTATVALRGAIYDMWRRQPAERYRTMRLLALDEIRVSQFISAFLNAFSLAVRSGISAPLANGQWRQSAHALRGFSDWLAWLGPITWKIMARPAVSCLARREAAADERQKRPRPDTASPRS